MFSASFRSLCASFLSHLNGELPLSDKADDDEDAKSDDDDCPEGSKAPVAKCPEGQPDQTGRCSQDAYAPNSLSKRRTVIWGVDSEASG